METRTNQQLSAEEDRHLVADLFRTLHAIKLRQQREGGQVSPEPTALDTGGRSLGPASPTDRAATDGPLP